MNETRQNPILFYLKMLVYIMIALGLRIVCIAPAACLFAFEAGSALRWLALLCPVLLIFVVLPLRLSFAEALVQQPGQRAFSLRTALNFGHYGEKLAESLLHALHVLKWGIPLVALVVFVCYWYYTVDMLTLMQTLTKMGYWWSSLVCAVGNLFAGLSGGKELVPSPNALMDGIFVAVGIVGIAVLVWVYGAVRNSARRYIWVRVMREDLSLVKELRRSLTGRRFAQIGVSLMNLLLNAPFFWMLGRAMNVLKAAIGDLATTLMMAITTETTPEIDLTAAVLPLVLAFVLFGLMLPARRMLTAWFANRRAKLARKTTGAVQQ